ncbi:hypothetical protein E2C01_044144 [Portunus trituberculatus]|uniref:Uncharacterized protein n=1 Tax=Portunus trituberculatus TaxID=210409 RepID=A0A5B7FYK7_PORTR|nr:hypothetical protein [Portunus trituberculatus]
MQFLIDNFGVSNLFGRTNYEYYARITGRILKVEEDWIFAFRYPPESKVSRKARTVPPERGFVNCYPEWMPFRTLYQFEPVCLRTLRPMKCMVCSIAPQHIYSNHPRIWIITAKAMVDMRNIRIHRISSPNPL